ncbi:MAG: histidine phosphatase family protein [Clostridium sp.]
MKKTLYLIRHGKTSYNEKRLYCGKSDISLSLLGKEEIEEKRVGIVKFSGKVEKFFTTGMKRTDETFQILFKDKEFEVIEEFREYNFGDFEGYSYEDLKDNGDYRNWLTDTTKEYKIPNGESKKEFYKRIEVGLNKALDKIENNCVVVCHGGVIGTLLELFSETNDYFYNLQPKCGGGVKVEVIKDKILKINVVEEF